MVEWAINAGIGGIIYQIFFYSGFVGLFIFLLCTCKKYKIEKWIGGLHRFRLSHGLCMDVPSVLGRPRFSEFRRQQYSKNIRVASRFCLDNGKNTENRLQDGA